MPLTNRKLKIDPNATYRAIDAFAVDGDDGVPTTVQTGRRLRGDQPHGPAIPAPIRPGRRRRRVRPCRKQHYAAAQPPCRRRSGRGFAIPLEHVVRADRDVAGWFNGKLVGAVAGAELDDRLPRIQALIAANPEAFALRKRGGGVATAESRSKTLSAPNRARRAADGELSEGS